VSNTNHRPPLTRRSFLSLSGRVACALSALAATACGRQEAPSPAAERGRWDGLIEHLEREIPSLLQRHPVTPGAAMALVADAKPLWARGFGVTDRTTNAPVTADTVFEFGSVSKTVFAYAVLLAHDNGTLHLDTPLTKYTRTRFLAGDPRLDLMTARHILSHTGGFQNWRSKEDVLRIQFTPGERWYYSGEGYSYLQSVLTELTGRVDQNDCKEFFDGVRVCGTDFDAYMRRTLFAPLGMTSSGYLYRDGMARPHTEKGVMVADRMATPQGAARYGSAGDLHSTVNDYVKFLIEILEPKTGDVAHLSPATREAMLRPQVKVTDTLSWGLGWAINPQPDGDTIISHSGDNPGFKTMTAASLRTRSAFIIVTNGDRGFDDVITPVLRSAAMREFVPVAV
jgi:CubicO group peptidase (beta-lactamase class C family)